MRAWWGIQVRSRARVVCKWLAAKRGIGRWVPVAAVAAAAVGVPAAFGQGQVVFNNYNSTPYQPIGYTTNLLYYTKSTGQNYVWTEILSFEGQSTNLSNPIGLNLSGYFGTSSNGLPNITNGPVTFEVDAWESPGALTQITSIQAPAIFVGANTFALPTVLPLPVITNVPARSGATVEDGCSCSNTLAANIPMATIPFQPPAAPTNDDFTSPWPLTGLAAGVVESTLGATAETNEPGHNGVPARTSVWFDWTAPYTGLVNLGFSNVLLSTYWPSVYTGTSLADLETVPTQEIVPTSPFSLGPIPLPNETDYQFAAIAGQTYHIAVDGYGSQFVALGNVFIYAPFTMQLQLGTVFLEQSALTNHFAAGQPVPLDFETTDFNSSISSLEAFVGTKSLGVAPNPPFHFVYQSADSDQSVCVYAIGMNVNGERVVSLPTRLNFRPSNDDFADATVIDPRTVMTNFTVNLSLATAESGEPPYRNGPAQSSVWWKWKPARSMNVRLSAVAADTGFPLEVFTGSSFRNLMRVADNSATVFKYGWSGAVRLNAQAGRTYWIRVDDNRQAINGRHEPADVQIVFSFEPSLVPLPGEVDFSLYADATSQVPAPRSSGFFPLGRVFMHDGRTPVQGGPFTSGSTGYYVAQLWTGKSPQTLQPMSQPQSFFYLSPRSSIGRGINASGMFAPEIVTLTNTVPGDVVFAQVRVWLQPYGGIYDPTDPVNSYGDAVANGLSYGASHVFRVRTGSAETGPGLLIGVGSFSLTR